MSNGPTTQVNFESMFQKKLQSGWFRKPRYRRLSYIFPRWAMKTKIRKTYHLPVAEIVEGRFLDLGCGLGSCAALRGFFHGGLNVGLDFAFQSVRYAQEESQRLGIPVSFVSGDGFRLPFKDAVFDSVYIGQVLEHLNEVSTFVAEAVRVLQEGGRLIVSVPKGESCGGKGTGHINFFYTEADCRRLLAGLPMKHESFHSIHRHRFFFSSRRVNG